MDFGEKELREAGCDSRSSALEMGACGWGGRGGGDPKTRFFFGGVEGVDGDMVYDYVCHNLEDCLPSIHSYDGKRWEPNKQ